MTRVPTPAEGGGKDHEIEPGSWVMERKMLLTIGPAASAGTMIPEPPAELHAGRDAARDQVEHVQVGVRRRS
jgi:hypothetical protein